MWKSYGARPPSLISSRFSFHISVYEATDTRRGIHFKLLGCTQREGPTKKTSLPCNRTQCARKSYYLDKQLILESIQAPNSGHRWTRTYHRNQEKQPLSDTHTHTSSSHCITVQKIYQYIQVNMHTKVLWHFNLIKYMAHADRKHWTLACVGLIQYAIKNTQLKIHLPSPPKMWS